MRRLHTLLHAAQLVAEAMELNVVSGPNTFSVSGSNADAPLECVPLSKSMSGGHPEGDLPAHLSFLETDPDMAMAIPSKLFRMLEMADTMTLNESYRVSSVAAMVETHGHTHSKRSTNRVHHSLHQDQELVRQRVLVDEKSERAVNGEEGLLEGGLEDGIQLDETGDDPGIEGVDAFGTDVGVDGGEYYEHAKADKQLLAAMHMDRMGTDSMIETDDTAHAHTYDLPLENVKDTQYMGYIGVGQGADGKPVPMRVVFDTGSTNLWVTGRACRSIETQGKGRPSEDKCEGAKKLEGIPQYDPDQSPDAAKAVINGFKNYLVHIKFGTGQLSGHTSQDTLHVGPFIVENQIFGVIEEETGSIFEELRREEFGGILGLAFPHMSAGHVVPFFDNVINQKRLPHPMFTMYMNMDSGKFSAILFGGVDERLVKPPALRDPPAPAGHPLFEMAYVNRRHYWSVKLLSMWYGHPTADSKPCDSSTPKGEACELTAAWRDRDGNELDPPHLVFDSGTTLYTGPGVAVAEIKEVVEKIRCDKIKEEVLDIVYRVEGMNKQADGSYGFVDIALKPHQYMVHDGHGGVGADGKPMPVGAQDCRPGFWTIDVPTPNGPAFLLGELFMKHYVTVYRREYNNQKALIAWGPANTQAEEGPLKDFLTELDGSAGAAHNNANLATFKQHMAVPRAADVTPVA